MKYSRTNCWHLRTFRLSRRRSDRLCKSASQSLALRHVSRCVCVARESRADICSFMYFSMLPQKTHLCITLYSHVDARITPARPRPPARPHARRPENTHMQINLYDLRAALTRILAIHQRFFQVLPTFPTCLSAPSTTIGKNFVFLQTRFDRINTHISSRKRTRSTHIV